MAELTVRGAIGKIERAGKYLVKTHPEILSQVKANITAIQASMSNDSTLQALALFSVLQVRVTESRTDGWDKTVISSLNQTWEAAQSSINYTFKCSIHNDHSSPETARRCEELREQVEFPEFATRINPAKFNFSPKLTAIVGAIIGHDYGVRDRKGGKLTSVSITSDGFVTCGSTASDGGGAFLGDAADLSRNLQLWLRDLSSPDQRRFAELYKTNVKDWRTR